MIQLTPSQESDVNWLLSLNKFGDPAHTYGNEPGTGKTPVVCAAMAKRKVKNGIIICPAPITVKMHWARHLVEMGVCGPDDITIIASGEEFIPVHRNFVIVNYEMLLKKEVYNSLYFGYQFDVIVVDEAQRLRGINSKTSRRILGEAGLISKCYYSWFVSGSIADRPIDWFPILKSSCPQAMGKHDTYESFGNHFCGGRWDEKKGAMNYNGSSNEAELRDNLVSSGFYRARSLKEVWGKTPEYTEKDIYIDIGTLPSGADETNTPEPTLRKEIGIAKIPYGVEFAKYLTDLHPGEKLMIFTYSREVSEGVTEQLNKLKIKTVLAYGGMSSNTKKAAFDAFKYGDAQILVAQQFSVGVAEDGFQLVCNRVLILEPDWGGGTYEQVIGRVVRSLQSKTVDIIIMLAQNTLDTRVARVSRRKQEWMLKLLKNTEINGEVNQMIETILERIAVALEEQNATLKAIAGGTAPKVPEKPAADKEKAASKPAAGKTAVAAKPAAKDSGAATAGTVAPTEDDVRQAATRAHKALKKAGVENYAAYVSGVLVALGSPEGLLADLGPSTYAEAIAEYAKLERLELPEAESADEPAI